MAHYLQQLLQAKEPLFSAGLKKLEQATGNTGVDARLIGDIHGQAYAAMRALGLDPKDTTNSELWQALAGKYPKNTLLNTSYVGLVTVDGVVSFNASDVKLNKNRTFSERSCDAMRQSLAQELTRRYVAANKHAEPQIVTLLKDCDMPLPNTMQKKGEN